MGSQGVFACTKGVRSPAGPTRAPCAHVEMKWAACSDPKQGSTLLQTRSATWLSNKSRQHPCQIAASGKKSYKGLVIEDLLAIIERVFTAFKNTTTYCEGRRLGVCHQEREASPKCELKCACQFCCSLELRTCFRN